MKTVDEILREMRKMGENYSKSESNDCRYVAYWLGTTFADSIEEAVKREHEAIGEVIREMGGCCSVLIKCGNCGKDEDVYFVPKGLIIKLKSLIAQGE